MTPETRMDSGRSRGVIGCLGAGFEMIPQNLQVAALPMALDLVLWLGPRISIGPLLDALVGFLTSRAPADAEMVGQMEQAVFLLEQFGERFNLLGLLGGTPVLQVPSLLARHAPGIGTPLGPPRVLSLGSVLMLLPWSAVLTLVGLVVGFLYLNEIAHGVQEREAGVGQVAQRDAEADAADASKGGGEDTGLPGSVRRLVRFLLFAGGLLGAGLVILPVWVTLVALAGAVAPALGILLWLGGVGFFSYAVLHLVFVIPSLLVGGRRLWPAIGESILLTHMNLSPVLGFVLLYVIIYEGLSYAWTLPRSDSWAMAIGIMGNGIVATGLAAAGFLFYRDRLEVASQLIAGRLEREA